MVSDSRPAFLTGGCCKETLRPGPQTDTYASMGHALLNHGSVSQIPSIREKYLQAYRLMVVARVLDDKFASLYRMGKIHGGVFLSRGQEAVSVSIGLALRKGDVFAP